MNTIIDLLLAIGGIFVATGIAGIMIAILKMPTQENQK